MALTLIILLGFFLRIINLPEWFYFTHDEETIAWRVMPLLRDANPFLLGGVTPFHVHLGPWFYYLSALILKLSQFNPLGWGIAAAIISLLTMWLIFYVGRLFFSHRVGLIALILYATSFLMIAFDRHWWPLYFDPLITLITLLSLYQIINGRSLYLILLSLSLAFGFHADPSNWGLILLTVITWIKFKPRINKKHLLSGIFILLVSFAPLVLFDLLHSGVNLAGVRQYWSETQPHQGWNLDRFWWVLLYLPRSLSRLIYAGSSDLTSIYSYCRQLITPHPITIIITLIVIISFAILSWRHRHEPNYWLLGSYFLLLLISLNLYGNFFSSDLFDHYLATLFPVFFLILAVVLDRFFLPWGLIGIISIIGLNLALFSRATTQDSYSLKRQAVVWAIEQVGDQPFRLDSLSSCFRYNGTRYLFTLAGKEPTQSFVDSNFSWLYRQPQADLQPQLLVIFVHQDFTGSLPTNIITRRSFGAWEVLILLR
jgi:hypothetical protein